MDKADRAGFTFFFIAVIFIAFIAGALAMLARVFPYNYLNDAYKAAHAAIIQLTETDLYTETHLWREARRPERGVTLHDPQRAYQA